MIDDLRRSVPVMTTKDILLELREDVKEIRSFTDVLKAAHLPERVDSLESSRDQQRGATSLLRAVFGISALAAVVGLVNLLDVVQLISRLL